MTDPPRFTVAVPGTLVSARRRCWPLQLDGDHPFFLNLGTDGIGYVLVRNDLRAGVFFWERPG